MTKVENFEKGVAQTKRTDEQDREAKQKPNVQVAKAEKKAYEKLYREIFQKIKLATFTNQKRQINGGNL